MRASLKLLCYVTINDINGTTCYLDLIKSCSIICTMYIYLKYTVNFYIKVNLYIIKNIYIYIHTQKEYFFYYLWIQPQSSRSCNPSVRSLKSGRRHQSFLFTFQKSSAPNTIPPEEILPPSYFCCFHLSGQPSRTTLPLLRHFPTPLLCTPSLMFPVSLCKK